MTPQEVQSLMLGNWVNPIGEMNPVRVNSIRQQQAADRGIFFINGYIPEHILPIPTTEDILLKAGFIKGNRTGSYGDNFIVWFNEFDIHQHEDGSFSYAVYIKYDGSFKSGYAMRYLHQLQNLYMVLTNSPLQIEL